MSLFRDFRSPRQVRRLIADPPFRWEDWEDEFSGKNSLIPLCLVGVLVVKYISSFPNYTEIIFL